MARRGAGAPYLLGRTIRWVRRVLAAVGLVVAVTPPVAMAATASWPFYGHDLANTRDAVGSGPTPAQVATLHVLWRFQSTHGDVTGTPVLAGGVLFVGSNGGYVYALKASTGTLLWSRSVGPKINGTAAVVGNTVYVPVNINESTGAGNPVVEALNATTGAVQWRTAIDTQFGADVYSSPVVYNGVLYIGTSGAYAECHAPTAHVRGSVVALNATTGARLWKTYTVPAGDDGGAVWTTPAIDAPNGVLYLGTGNAYDAPAASTTDAVLKLALPTGKITGGFQAHAGDVSRCSTGGADVDFGASPNLFASSTGTPLVGEGDKAGDYWALTRPALALRWMANVGPTGPLGGILGSTAWDGSALYGPLSVNTEAWSLTSAGARRWTATLGGGTSVGPVSIANGVLYASDNAGNLVARAASTGAVLKSVALGAASSGGVAIVGQTIFTDTGTGSTASGYVDALGP